MRVDLEPFEENYRDGNDPWAFATSPYEQHRYDVIEEALGDRRYERCFEPGCAVGSLTERLARHAVSVIASDASPSALASASKCLAGIDNVKLVDGPIPEYWPSGLFDLIVFSELGYYWDAEELQMLTERLHASLAVGGDLVAVHWLGSSEDHLLGGRKVHEVLGADRAGPILSICEDDFILEMWRR